MQQDGDEHRPEDDQEYVNEIPEEKGERADRHNDQHPPDEATFSCDQAHGRPPSRYRRGDLAW